MPIQINISLMKDSRQYGLTLRPSQEAVFNQIKRS
jgi:hypothetical protein